MAMTRPLLVRLVLALALGCQRSAEAVSLRVKPEPNSNPGFLRPGTEVVLCGLKHSVEANGHSASVLRFDANSSRYSLRLKSGPRVQVDAKHVLPKTAKCDAATLVNGTQVNGTSILANRRQWEEAPGCTEACDACYMDNLDASLDAGTTPTCFAVCKKGCQMYCDESTAGIPGCSQNEVWEANVPGQGLIPAPTSLGAEHGPVCSFDHGEATSCNRFRWCTSQDQTGCPEAYLY